MTGMRETWATVFLAVPLAVGVASPPPASAAPGDLDPSFGSGGKLIASFSPLNRVGANAVAVQRDGKIVTASGGDGLTVARFNPDGTRDRSFHGDGVRVVRFGGRSDFSGAEALAISRRSGRIVLGGTYAKQTSPPPDDESEGEFDRFWALVRLNGNGTLDRRFSRDGKRLTRFGSGEEIGISDLALTSRGKIIAVGDGGNGFGVARYRPSGRLDRSFSRDGKRTVRFFRGESGQTANAVALKSRGRIVVAGSAARDSDEEDATSDFAIAQLTHSGRLDRRFGRGGRVTTAFSDREPTSEQAFDVKVDRRGRVVAGGDFEPDFESQFALTRYTPRGRLDRSFSGNGLAATRVGSGAGVRGLVLAPAGRIIVAGTASIPPPGGTGTFDSQFALARYGPAGGLDRSFAGDGIQITPISAGADEASGVARQRDGRIVVAGVSDGATALARYLVR